MRAGEGEFAAGTAHVPEVDQEQAEMEADGLRMRKPANQGAEVRKRQGRPILVVEPDGRGGERLRVGRRESRGRLELTFGRDGPELLLKGCAAQKPGLNGARRLREARDKGRQVNVRDME